MGYLDGGKRPGQLGDTDEFILVLCTLYLCIRMVIIKVYKVYGIPGWG